jgi:hypothetical protein
MELNDLKVAELAISDFDVTWNQLGYKSGDCVAHLYFNCRGNVINFWGRFDEAGNIRQGKKYKFEVNHRPSDDNALLGDALSYIKKNWDSGQEIHVEAAGHRRYRVTLGDQPGVIVEVRDIVWYADGSPRAFTFKRPGHALLKPFGSVIRAIYYQL